MSDNKLIGMYWAGAGAVYWEILAVVGANHVLLVSRNTDPEHFMLYTIDHVSGGGGLYKSLLIAMDTEEGRMEEWIHRPHLEAAEVLA